MNSFTQYLRLALIFLALVLPLLIWQGYTDYQQFKQFHEQLSERSVSSTSREIHALMESKKKTVRLFVKQEIESLINLINYSKNSDAKLNIGRKIEEYFPHHLTFLVADKTGSIQFSDAEILVGKTCRKELVSYAKSNFKDNPIFIHPGTQINSDHFDVLTPIQHNGEKIGVFFISFRLDILRRVLSHGEVANHHLLLLREDQPFKIELRSNTEYLADIKQLPDLSQKRIYYSTEIKNSLWNLVDIPDDNLFTKEYKRLFIQGLIVLFVFSLISEFMLWLLRKEELKSGKTCGLLSILETERRRIAMDMHDQILSELSHISRETSQLAIDPKAKEGIKQLQDNLSEVTDNIRSIINDLHPHILDNLGLESALRDCLQKHVNKPYSPEWTLDIDDEIEFLLNDEQRFNLYRIILELVNNIQKHANCRHFSILMRLEGDIIRLIIEDDGSGFEISRTHKGLGINNIEARCRLLKARMSWNKPKKNSGSRFVLTLKSVK